MGSDFIYKTAMEDLRENKSKVKDLEQLIDDWNDPKVKTEDMSSALSKNKSQ